jgi:hypothetical protein
MTILFYVFLAFFFSSAIELFCGSMGIIIPLTALVAFYFSMVFGWRIAVSCAIFSGLAIDLLYGRSFFITAPLLSIGALIALPWIYRPESKSLFLNALLGGAIAGIYLIPLSMISAHSLGMSFSSFFQNISNLIFGVAFGIVFTPFLIVALDELAEKLGCPLFRDARAKLMK